MMAALVNHLWQSTLVAAVAWLATLALRRERAGVRYGVWLAASVKFLVPLSWLTTLGARIGWRPVVVASFVPYQMTVETSAGLWPQQAVRVSTMPAVMDLTHRLFTVLPDVLLAVWVSGALALTAIWLVRWRRISKIAQASTPLTRGPIVEALRRIEMHSGSHVGSPSLHQRDHSNLACSAFSRRRSSGHRGSTNSSRSSRSTPSSSTR